MLKNRNSNEPVVGKIREKAVDDLVFAANMWGHMATEYENKLLDKSIARQVLSAKFLKFCHVFEDWFTRDGRDELYRDTLKLNCEWKPKMISIKISQMNYLAISILLILMFWSGIAHAQLGHAAPMWEGYEKTESDLAADEELIKKSLELTNGDATLAAQYAVGAAWERIGKGDPDGAIRRFNQAWLLKPDLPDIFWGFGIATHIRGDDLADVERWFARVEGQIQVSARMSTDYGRVLEERQLPKRARPLFEQALALDPNYKQAHFGMIRVAEALGDDELARKHQEIYDGLEQ